ncbi:MAG: 8-amino-7-oxononanoate synthase [Gammaproteobacteria bacterium]
MKFDLEETLNEARVSGLYRSRRVSESAQSVHTVINGKPLIAFCSNDYLGLANHPEVNSAFKSAIDQWGSGSGSAHLINGHSRIHHECEEQLARLTGRDRALLFSTGYMANIAVATTLVGRRDFIFQDKLNHASLIDAARLSRATTHRYRHNDLDHLEYQLGRSDQAGRKLIMTDGVFSMDGDQAPLSELTRLADKYEAWTMVDDAHGFGVLGESGGGLLDSLSLNQSQVPVMMATLGKAVGTAGAFVAGSDALIESLIQSARPYIFTTAMPPAIAAATLCSLNMIETESWRRERLKSLISHFKNRINGLGCRLLDSNTAIQPIIIGDNQLCNDLSAQLYQRGFLVTAIRPPTVPKNTARLRVTLSAQHSVDDIDGLIDSLADILEKSEFRQVFEE